MISKHNIEWKGGNIGGYGPDVEPGRVHGGGLTAALVGVAVVVSGVPWWRSMPAQPTTRG